jgi:catechol 2,3-dioxygenase-like lactoylglutathione lyase family enzyme
VAAKIGNIVFDCENPRELSHFWSDVLGYPRADYPEDMRAALLSAGLSEDDLAARSVAIDPTGESPRLFFQRVPEGKVVKNRVHLDVNATPGRRASPAEVDAEVERVVALGATVLHLADALWGPYPEYHYVLADPEGNEFCVQ